jgi:hypothetical protein
VLDTDLGTYALVEGSNNKWFVRLPIGILEPGMRFIDKKAMLKAWGTTRTISTSLL